MSKFERENKTIRLTIVARDKATKETVAGVVLMTWRKEVPLKKIMEHVVDAIEMIDV